MKRLFGIVAVAACLSLGSVDKASAAGPFIITFPGFCDCITIYTAALGVAPGGAYIYGTWDWTCAGAPPYAPVSGVKKGFVFGGSPHVPIESDFTATFDLSSAGTADLFGTAGGGAGDAFLFVDNTPVVVAAGSCPGAPFNGMPSLLPNRQ